MDEDLKRRIQQAKLAGYTDQEINAVIQAKQQQDAARSKQKVLASQSQNTGIPISNAVQEPKKEGIITNIAKAIVKPGVDAAKLVMGTGFEGARAVSHAMGNKDAYDINKGAKNPFISREEFSKDYATPEDIALNVGKKAAGVASYFVPAGKLAQGAGVGAKVIQGARVGAEVGGLYGASQSEKKDLEGIATDTVKGSIEGGLTGGALGFAGGVATKMKGAKNAADKAIVNPQVAASPTAPQQQQKILDELNALGINKGTASERYAKVNQVYNQFSDEAKAILDKSTQTRSAGRLTSVTKSNIAEKGEYFIPDDTRHIALLDRELKLLNKKAIDGKLTAKQLFDFKMELGSKLKNAFRKESGDLNSPISDIEGVRLDLWHNIDDIITGIEPGVKKVTQKMSVLHKASPGLQKASEKTAQLTPLGIPTGINIAPMQQGITDKAGRVMSGIGGVAGEVPQVVNNAVLKGASMNAASTGSPESVPIESTVDPIQQDVQGDTTISDDVQFTSPDGQWQMKSDGKAYSIDGQWMWDETSNDWIANPQADTQGGIDWSDEDMVVQLMQQDLQTTGGKNIPEMEKMYAISSKQSGGEKKLTVAQQKRMGALDQAEGIYSMVEDLALNAGTGVGAYGKSLIGTLPGVEGGSEEDLGRVTQALAKGLAGSLANEVGVATDKDIERWMGLMPKITDTMEERQRALERLKSEIIRARQVIEGNPEEEQSGLSVQNAVTY